MNISVAHVNITRSADHHLYREHGRNDYMFVLFKSPVMVRVHGEYVPAGAGNCMIFGKNMIQDFYCNSEELLVDYMHFTPDQEYEQMLLNRIPCDELIPVFLPQLLSDILLSIENERKNRYSNHKKEVLTHLGAVFLLRLINELENTKFIHQHKKSYNTLYALRRRIYRDPQLDWSVENACKQTYMSRSHFQHLYQEFFSTSCIQDVTAARISKAKELLVSSDLHVNRIGELCGYKTTEHFIRQFKKLTGTTPSKFRDG